jgi:hypothetical protein
MAIADLEAIFIRFTERWHLDVATGAPLFMIPAANPPSGIGAGYAAMDALTRRIVKRLRARNASVPALVEAV